MEQSETTETVINFGKRLIAEYEGEDDPLVRWVCLHIASLINQSESKTDDSLNPVHQKCMDVILSFWASRSDMDYKLRPFKDWEIIFETIDNLKNSDSFFYGTTPLEEKKNLLTFLLKHKSHLTPLYY